MIYPLKMEMFVKYLAPRKKDSHKYDYGHVLGIGGDHGFAGAIRLAGEAALRIGAGAVSLATQSAHANVLTASCPELMCQGITKIDTVKKMLTHVNFVMIGPGLGQNQWGKDLLGIVLSDYHDGLLIDADGLNNLAVHSPVSPRNNWILTPHPGEAARLLGVSSREIQNNRLDSIKKLRDLFGGAIVLKGSNTLIMTTDSDDIFICEAGNPGMSTAGMGDVLTGIISGLAAQSIPLGDAAKLGVLIHAMAGDLAARSGERGIIASDLFSFLKSLINLKNHT